MILFFLGYDFGVIAFSAVTFFAIKMMCHEAALTGEMRGWSDAYFANRANLKKVDASWVFKNDPKSTSRKLDVGRFFSGCDEISNEKQVTDK